MPNLYISIYLDHYYSGHPLILCTKTFLSVMLPLLRDKILDWLDDGAFDVLTQAG